MIYTLYLSSLVASAMIAAVLAYFLWQRRTRPGATPAVWLMLAVVVISVGYVLEYTSTTLYGKFLATNLQYVGIVSLPVMWFAFSLGYTGHAKWLTRRNLLLLAIVPSITLILAWTNGIDGLMWHNRHLETSGPFLIIAKTYGPWFWVHTSYLYLLILPGAFLLLQRLFRPPRLYRKQSIALLICVIVPLVCNVLYIFNVIPTYRLDLSPSAFAISGLAIAWGLFQVRLFDITPFSRDNIVNTIGDAVIMLDKENRFVDFNRAAESVVGFTLSEAIGQPVADVMSEQPNLVELFCSTIDVAKGPVEVEIEKGETQYYYASDISPMYDHRGHLTGRLIILSDITKRKQAERMLQESEEKYRDLCDNASELIQAVTPDGNFLYVNKAWKNTLGYSEEDIAGLTLWNIIHPDSIPHCMEIFQKVMLGEPAYDVEADFVAQDGRIITVEGSASCRFEEGKPVSTRGIFNDITKRKQAEERERQLQEELHLTSRLATVGEMSAGIAHEINNPLTGVIGFSDLLLKKDLPEDVKKDVEVIHNGAKRIASITERMLAFARQRKPERDSVNINDIIETALAMRTYEMESSNIKVTTQLDPDIPLTYVDAGQLQQVFLNIILNAEMEMKLAHGKGNLAIKTDRIDNTIRISFKDDGPGIPKKNLERLFDPFFTTRDPDKGTGLGLSVSYSIVTQHGGKIYAQSRLGRGATFFVELPTVTQAEQLELDEPVFDEPKKVFGARILVVDDEPIVQQLLTEILSEEGHRVEIIANGEDALERLGSEDYDAILLDIKLPGMSGIDLYKHMQRSIKPLARRVIFITGDVMNRDTAAFLAENRALYVTKPFDTEQLKESIGRIISQ